MRKPVVVSIDFFVLVLRAVDKKFRVEQIAVFRRFFKRGYRYVYYLVVGAIGSEYAALAVDKPAHLKYPVVRDGVVFQLVVEHGDGQLALRADPRFENVYPRRLCGFEKFICI